MVKRDPPVHLLSSAMIPGQRSVSETPHQTTAAVPVRVHFQPHVPEFHSHFLAEIFESYFQAQVLTLLSHYLSLVEIPLNLASQKKNCDISEVTLDLEPC